MPHGLIRVMAVPCRSSPRSFAFSSSPELFNLDYVRFGHDTIALSEFEVFGGCTSAKGRGYVLVLCLGARLPASVTARQSQHREGRTDYVTLEPAQYGNKVVAYPWRSSRMRSQCFL